MTAVKQLQRLSPFCCAAGAWAAVGGRTRNHGGKGQRPDPVPAACARGIHLLANE